MSSHVLIPQAATRGSRRQHSLIASLGFAWAYAANTLTAVLLLGSVATLAKVYLLGIYGAKFGPWFSVWMAMGQWGITGWLQAPVLFAIGLAVAPWRAGPPRLASLLVAIVLLAVLDGLIVFLHVSDSLLIPCMLAAPVLSSLPFVRGAPAERS